MCNVRVIFGKKRTRMTTDAKHFCGK